MVEHIHNFVVDLTIAIEDCTEGPAILGIGGRPSTNIQGSICDICGQLGGEPEGNFDSRFVYVQTKEVEFKKLSK